MCKLPVFITVLILTVYSKHIYCDSIESSDERETTTELYKPTQTEPIIDTRPLIKHDPPKFRDPMTMLNDQLYNINSLYIGRLDQKLTSLVSNVVSIDSNVKNIQERAHVWDTFQLHVSAWNDQIKSLDRKVDIINSGQEKMSLLESKLAILLNLEYNSARIINKLTSLEDRMDNLERSFKRQSSDILSSINQKELDNADQSSKNMLNAVKTIDKKTDRLMGMIQRNTPLGRRFARNRFSNDSQSPQKILIKCSTPPVIEETVKDIASKVDLIYDKIISDNISKDDCDSEYGGKTIEESAEELVDEIESDYSVLSLNSDEDDSGNKPFKRETRNAYKGFKRNKRSESSKYCHGEIIETIKGLVEEMHKKLQCSNTSADITKLSEDLENLKNNLQYSNKINTTSFSIENRIQILSNQFKDICKQINEEYTTGVQSEMKRYCYLFSLKDKNKEIAALTECIKEKRIVPAVEEPSKTITPTIPVNTTEHNNTHTMEHSLNETELAEEFKDRCQKYFKNFETIKIEDIGSPEELTCYVVYSHSMNKTEDLCAHSKARFCDDQGFLVFQSRINAKVNFTRNWKEYKWGFGDFDSGNYWIGNEALHLFTMKPNPAILKINIWDFDATVVWAEYDRFSLSSESDGYRIHVSGYRGNSSDSLSYHNGAAFSTVDERHDEAPACCPCANTYGGGGWWYKSCHESNLNGIYFDTPHHPHDGGLTWELWRPNSTLSRSIMALGFLSSTITYDVEDP